MDVDTHEAAVRPGVNESAVRGQQCTQSIFYGYELVLCLGKVKVGGGETDVKGIDCS